ncbi:unnamed protein product, partial [Phaeothamnion confervicola]
MEFFWNRSRAEQCQPPQPGSAHGRVPYSVLSVKGEQKAPEPPLGRTVVVDVDGATVRPGQGAIGAATAGTAARVASLVGERMTLKMNGRVKPHWDAVVVHSGWLLKQGGSSMQKWLWRFCVLYSTAQGHFLSYYVDIPETPLYSETGSHAERGTLDMSRIAFIRPVSAAKDTPPNAFDLVLLDKEWTLCADSPKAMLLWMQVLARAAESDVAVMPDDETVFRVALASGGEEGPGGAIYTVTGEALVKISSMGVSIQQLNGINSGSGMGDDGEVFYPYTDFFKWVLVDLRDGMHGLLLKCFLDDSFEARVERLIVHAHAADIAAHIEYHIEKFMAFMHLRYETHSG